MRWPFKGNYKITQKFGENIIDYLKYGIKGHNGVDHGVPCGTSLYAMITGKVIEAQFDRGYGNYVKIENHKEGALVAHLSELAVKPGDNVIEGETLLGKSGTTGNSTGCHTHTGYYLFPRDRINGYNGYIDPIPHITPEEQMVTLPLKELDEIRQARDSHWNVLQVSLEEIKHLKAQLADREKKLSECEVKQKEQSTGSQTENKEKPDSATQKEPNLRDLLRQLWAYVKRYLE